jgi:2-phospho-L-lactate guanylyltransferase
VEQPSPPRRVLAVIPIKGFSAAKRRLGGVLDATRRRGLAVELATRVTEAWAAAGHDVLVVAGDDEAATWARARDLEVIHEPVPGGLDASAAAGLRVALARHLPWCVTHADLPLFDSHDAAAVACLLGPNRVVLAPARDGGTNVIAGTEPIGFSYGPGSFGRHLSAARHFERVALVRAGTALDLDGPDDLRAASALPRGRWLDTYLGCRS